MNWSRSKTWLILLFLGVNVFMAIYLINSNAKSSYLDNNTVQQTLSILSQNGISVDVEIIPKHIPSLNSVEVANSLTDGAGMAQRILGEGNTKAEGFERYSKDNKVLAISGDTVEYTDDAPNEAIANLSEKTAPDIAKQQLLKYGFDMKHAVCSYTGREAEQYVVRVDQKIDKYALFDSYFIVKLAPNGLGYFIGSWFVPAKEKGMFNSAEQVKSSASVLIDFVSDPMRISQGSTKIVGISIGYTTGEKGIYHKSVTAMPVWQISTDDGNSYYYDAR